MDQRTPDAALAATAAAEAYAASRQRLAGIGLMVGALFFFACLDSCAKYLNQHIDPWQVVWVRYASAFFLTLMFVNPWNTPGLLETRKIPLQLFRSTLLLASTALNFFALQYLQLDQTISIMFTTPLIVALIAGPLLGEWIGPRRLIAVAIGFIGVLVVTRPGLSGFHWAMLLSATGAVCYAIYNIATRVLAKHDSTHTTLFYSNLIGFAATMPLMPLVWTTPTSWFVWLLMVLIGAFGAFGHFLLIAGHRKAPAPILAPFIYTQIVWMIGFGWLFFGQLPSVWTITGAAIVIASGLYLLYRERVRGVAR